MKTKGILMVLEGIDNAGKTHQIKLLAKHFRKLGTLVVITKELTSPVGNFIRKKLYSNDLNSLLKTVLFATDRIIRYEKTILPALEKGSLVLADRWKLSALVYRSMERFDVKFVNAVNSKTPNADLTIILDLPAKISIERGKKSNKISLYNISQLEDVRKRYLENARINGFTVINASQPPEIVFEQIVTHIKSLSLFLDA